MDSDPTHVGSDGDHPSDAELAELAWGGTAVGVKLSEHLARCARCAAIVARSGEGHAATAVGTLASAETVSATRASTPVIAPGLGKGTMVGRYRIEATLGQGGMGVVYRATDTELDRPVALKLVKSTSSSVVELTERLRRESRLQARASHPSVITVHDIGIDGDRVYVAMELASGGTLRAWLAAAPRPWREIVDVFRRAGEGLAAAHAAGLVHRDFKPDNVLLDVRDGRVTRVLVSDFGVARALEGAERRGGTSERVSAMDLTTTGELIGTPAYMSPEQLRGEAVDARTDIFAFGVALWEALHGERPFRASTIAELVIALEGPPSGSPRADKLPRWLEEALRRMLAIAPAQRFASMAEVLAELERGTRRRRSPVIVASAAVLALAGGIVAYRVAGEDAAVDPDACDLDPRGGAALVEAAGRFARAEVPKGHEALRATWALHLRNLGDAITRLRAETCTAPVRPATWLTRVQCLDLAASQFESVVERGLQLDVRDRGSLVESTPPLVPYECASEAAAAAMLRFPGEDIRDAVTAVRVDLIVASRSPSGPSEDDLAKILSRGDAVGFAPLRHELAFLRATRSGSIDALREVASAADREGIYYVAAESWQRLVEDAIEVSEQRASDRLAQAELALRRAGDPPLLLAMQHALRARLAAHHGRAEESRAAVAASQQVLQRVSLERALTINMHLGVSEMRIGDFSQALARHESVYAFLTQHEARSVVYQNDLVMARNVYAATLVGVGRPEDALRVLEPAVAKGPPDGSARAEFAGTLSQLLLVYVQLGRYEDAARVGPEYTTLVDSFVGARPNARALVRSYHATALLALGRYAEAERASREALERLVENQGRAHYDTADVRVLHAQALLGMGRITDALDEAERGYLDLAKAGDASDPLVMQGRLVYARALVAAGRPADALPHLEATLEPFRAVVPADEAARQELVLAEALVALRRERPRAKAIVTRALEVLAKTPHSKEDVARAKRLLRALR